MKYTVAIEINLPRKDVVELFMNPDNYPKWMEGLETYEVLEGEHGKDGARSRYFFKTGKREITMIETILKNDLPERLEVNYKAKGVYNNVISQFEIIDDKSTRYISIQEFRFKGFMKMLGWFMPGAFKKQTYENLEAFKKFVESDPEN
ncbi:SRPBCC family protein [Salinivirga cyanobacteriivorans]